MAGTLYDRVGDLAARLDALASAPDRSRDERAVHDAWRITVRPRIARMRRRAARLADPRHWEFDAKRRPERLRPTSWNLVAREAAALYAELAGALAQHQRTRIVWSPRTRFGIHRGTKTPIPTAKMKPKEREAARRALDQARKARMEKAKKVLDDVVKRMEATRKALGEARDEVRHLVAQLQAAEAVRLARRVDRLEEGSKDREEAEDLLVAMVRGRLRAARFRDERAAGYGSLLRQGWLVPRAKLVRLVEGP